MNATINLGINKQSALTYLAQLSHNKKRELFFRPLWGQTKPTIFYDKIVKGEFDIRNIDHISFHEDGTIHLRMMDSLNNKSTLFHKKLVNTLAAIPEDGYGMLLIFSIYNFDEAKKFFGRSTSLTFNQSKNVDMQFEIESINRFSFVVFLLGQRVDIKHMFLSKFSSILNPGNAICIEDYLVYEKKDAIGNKKNIWPNDLRLLIAYTEKVIQAPPTNLSAPPKLLKQSTRVEPLFGLSIASSDDRVRQLV